jgi:hypothetical protein
MWRHPRSLPRDRDLNQPIPGTPLKLRDISDDPIQSRMIRSR